VENFSVNSGENISHPAGSLFGVVTAMLSLVAGVSLVVGGIGVMNIMFVSVAERTREIGIRKAVGASSTNILLQFLFEALILSLMGGLLGLALGYAVAFLVSLWTPFPPFISGEIVGLAFAIAIVIGSVFGLLPAIRAARKDPIDSLKFYR
jgi:putative ABC transport system permease protein